MRRYQHQMARQADLTSHSYGREPNRYVRIFRFHPAAIESKRNKGQEAGETRYFSVAALYPFINQKIMFITFEGTGRQRQIDANWPAE